LVTSLGFPNVVAKSVVAKNAVAKNVVCRRRKFASK
jgi:hypothetical protein